MVLWASIFTGGSGPANVPGGPKLRAATSNMAKTTVNLYPTGPRQGCEAEEFVLCALVSLLMTLPFLWCSVSLFLLTLS